MSNLGHRLGEGNTTKTENTIERMKRNLNYQVCEKFKYWEFDINETKDGSLVVYHDRNFKKYGDKRRLRDMTLAEIKHEYPFVPSLKELLIAMKEETISKPIRIEIKRLVSSKGRDAILRLAEEFRRSVHSDVQFIAFRSHFKKSFPKDMRDYWAFEFRVREFKVLNVKNKKQDLFNNDDSLINRFLNWI